MRHHIGIAFLRWNMRIRSASRFEKGVSLRSPTIKTSQMFEWLKIFGRKPNLGSYRMTKFPRAMKLIDFTDGAIENILSFFTLGNCLVSKLVLARLMKSQIHEFAAL